MEKREDLADKEYPVEAPEPEPFPTKPVEWVTWDPEALREPLIVMPSNADLGSINRASFSFWRAQQVKPRPFDLTRIQRASEEALAQKRLQEQIIISMMSPSLLGRLTSLEENPVDEEAPTLYDAALVDLTRRDDTPLTTMPPPTTTPLSTTRIDPLTLKHELIYGRSGSGKTSWILKIARYLYKKTGKRTRWYIADGGAETITATGWAGPGGFIDLYLFSARNNPVETSQLICEGYWPVDPLDPNTKLRPPTAEDLETVGLWVFEGLTYVADYIMGEKQGGLAWRMARGERLNNDDSFRFKDGDIQFGGNARTHYGFTQRKILDLTSRTANLPGMKYWTAHEVKVDDTDYRESIFGPDVCGQKLTTRIGASFGNTIHLQVAHLEEKRKDNVTGKEVKIIRAEHRAYLQTHFDPDGVTTARYYANTRIDARVRAAYPDLVPEYVAGADPLRFYGLLDLARQKEAELDARIEELPDLPGLTETAPPVATTLNRPVTLT